MLERDHVGQDRMGGDGLGRGMKSGKAGERGRQVVHGREHVDGRLVAGLHAQVKLIDGLKLGDLEKERAATGEHMGRLDRERIVAGLAGVAG